jgi:hypothetical protein
VGTIAAVVVAAGTGAGAADYTWVATGREARFGDGWNWSPQGGPPGAGDTFTLTGPFNGQIITQSKPTTVAGATVRGGNFVFSALSDGLTITGNSRSALRVEGVGGGPTWFFPSGRLSVPNGGIMVVDTVAQRTDVIPVDVQLGPSATVSADSLSVIDGIFDIIYVEQSAGRLAVAHDVEVGHAPTPAPPGNTSAILSNGGLMSVGGTLRVHRDGIFGAGSTFGPTTVAGGVLNDGRIDASGQLAADVTNRGIFVAGPSNTPFGIGLTMDGRFVQTADGELREWVLPSEPAKLVVSGSAVDLTGTVTLYLTSVSQARVGDRYFLIDTDAPVQFSATIRSTDPQLKFEPLIIPGEGLYAVLTEVPEPSCAGLIAAAAVALRRRGWRS